MQRHDSWRRAPGAGGCAIAAIVGAAALHLAASGCGGDGERGGDDASHATDSGDDGADASSGPGADGSLPSPTDGSGSDRADGTLADAAAGDGSQVDARAATDGSTDAVADARADSSAADARADAPVVDASLDAAVDAGAPLLAATPPMGWNSWNTFQCSISESLIESVADAFVTSGMSAAGYQYVNIDDCWMNGRDASGNLQWDATKFPSGIPALAAYVHGKGLKLGMYETPNTETCVGIYAGVAPAVAVGSLGHEAADAKTFASWGVDFLKYDLCQGSRASFPTMRDALRGTGRPIVYSINPGNGPTDLFPPTTPGWDVVSIANMWRIAFDINASYASVTSIIDQDAPFWTFAGPGHWNDADMLEVGNGMTPDEDRSHFSMWAMLASPLLAGNDVRSMSATTRDILTNADVIALSQDPLGAQAQLVATPQANLQIWSKTLAGQNVRGVALLNRSAAAASITVSFGALGLPAGNATVRDLWAQVDRGTFAQSYTAAGIASHGVAVLRIASSP